MDDCIKKMLDCLLQDGKSFEATFKECLRQELETCLNSLLKSEFGTVKINIPRGRLNEFKTRKLDENYFAIYLDGTFIPIRRETVEKVCFDNFRGQN